MSTLRSNVLYIGRRRDFGNRPLKLMPERRDVNSKSPYAVHLRFAPCAGHAPREVEWTEPPLTLRRVDGAVEVIGSSRDLMALVRHTLSYGSYAEALGPERLRRLVAAEARRVVRLYADAPALSRGERL